MEKKTLQIIAIAVGVLLIAAFAFGLIDTEKFLWIATVGIPTLIAVWKNIELKEKKEDLLAAKQQNRILNSENIKLRNRNLQNGKR